MFATASDDTKLWYERTPGPNPVLLIHGFASDAQRTWGQTGWPRALAERGQLLVDLRGHGQSDHAASGFEPEALARDMCTVLDAAGVSTVDVLSYSMGGLIAWELARLAPERVRRMVLGGISGRPVDAAEMRAIGESLGTEGLDACIAAVSGRRLEGPPPAPALLVAGEADETAEGAADFADSLGVPFARVPKRNHLNTVSSRVFKQAALEFLQ